MGESGVDFGAGGRVGALLEAEGEDGVFEGPGVVKAPFVSPNLRKLEAVTTILPAISRPNPSRLASFFRGLRSSAGSSAANA